MRSIIVTASVAILCLGGAIMPVRAEAGGYYAQRHAPVLHPTRLPRRPHFTAPLREAPDFLIQGYLPRTTETPLYNEPPSRFPRR